MARGGRTAEADGTWRPSPEDADILAADDMLEAEMINEAAPGDVKAVSSSRKSPLAHRHKKTARKPKHQDDETWRPTDDEDLEAEELEVQEMVNDQLLSEDEKHKTPPKKTKSTGRKKGGKGGHQSSHEEDEVWRPDGGDSDEVLEYEELETEDSGDDEPAVGKQTPKKTRKRPAASSAGSPVQHKKPEPQPKHRLTQAVNRKPPTFLVQGDNPDAPFTFAAYRGEGSCMLAMNWKKDTPPNDFVGFVIEYREPQSRKWWPIPNYLTFPGEAARSGPDAYSSRLSPIQRFRWVHFPFTVDIPGSFHYRVTPVFMKGEGGSRELTYGEVQEVAIELIAETYPGRMNVAFTRGFISSKAFVKKFGADGGIGNILPSKADEGLEFKPKDAEVEEKALTWMGFEAREVILATLDAAIQDATAQVRVLAYDLNSPEIVQRLQKLGKRVKVIIDDSGSHGGPDDAESKAAVMLQKTAGKDNVQRQHMGNLQHNKVLVVDGEKTKIAIGGSTNFSWRGLYVQNNNLVALQGAQPVDVFKQAFDNYWTHPNDTDGFYKTASSQWIDLGLKDVDAQVTFSPHSSNAGTLDGIASDIKAAESSLFYSLAFLYETPGVIRDAIEKKTSQKGIMVYGLSDKSVGGLDIKSNNGNPPIAYPEDFDNESAGGSGARMHHKFVVIDFNKPTARVYTGSHNFSVAADTKNAENLFLIRDQRVATAYMIQAVSMFDHYEVRDHVQKKKKAEAKGEAHAIHLKLPPAKKGERAWWDQYWTVKQKIHDREMFGV
ncbi:Phospholipase D [Cytospora mali]|uniref:Mitochondrial cardiolipin hydrolase n=1 Tax=Cytospora mali TaxID=578113 RepID=A0A194V313_CYTMA|nr:Phospholipase D [Valsa mali var. pyri (nom. inval.)]